MADVRNVADFFIDLSIKQSSVGNGVPMTNLRLQTLVYLAQGWYLARFGKPLFDAPIEAGQQGPVVREIYDRFEEFDHQPCGRPSKPAAGKRVMLLP